MVSGFRNSVDKDGVLVNKVVVGRWRLVVGAKQKYTDGLRWKSNGEAGIFGN